MPVGTDSSADMEGTGEDAGTGPGPAEVDPDPSYTRVEWTEVLFPAIIVLVLVIMFATAWYLLGDAEQEEHILEDVNEEGSFNLVGYWSDDPVPYGSQARAINLTLEVGDIVSLDYSAIGPPGGIHVRLQHPLHPQDGANGTGGTTVLASSVGGNGTIDLFVEEGGAYQIYFWHPGSSRPPGEVDDPSDHVTAAVAYRLTVTRANRP